MQLGDIRIDRILEMETPFMAPESMFPDATPDDVARHRHWMEPWALDPVSGKTLWQQQLQPGIATPISFALDGKQYIAVMSGIKNGKVYFFAVS